MQVWGLASKGKSQLSYITDTYSFLKAEGYVFPPINEHTDSIVLESSAVSELICNRLWNETLELTYGPIIGT